MKSLGIYFFSFVLIACTKKVNTPQSVTQLTMSPSTWVVYMYKDGTMQNPINRADTLIFTTNTAYTYNGTKSTYALNPAQNNFNLSLQNTAFGNLSGTIPSNFEQGNIIDAPFNPINTNGQIFYLWLKKL